MEVSNQCLKIITILESLFAKDEYPCLLDQYNEFSDTRPFRDMSILHSTPVFTNSLPKLLSLVAGGANLTIVSPNFIEADPGTVKILQSLELNFVTGVQDQQQFDVVLDCAGSHANIISKTGSVELTQSGQEKYKNSKNRFINVDNSECKKIEDHFGTADGFIRAMKQSELLIEGKKFLLIGCGKVGKGILAKLEQLKATVAIIDPLLRSDERHFNQNSYDLEFDYVITATGCSGAAEEYRKLINPKTKLINMGAEDEFGITFKESDVLNNKKPFNFILKHPTQLKYLDPIFALQNKSILSLMETSNIGFLSTSELYDDYYKNIFYAHKHD